ncbi:MAG: gamma-glutamyl-gamma-aminobutyrate hydrolase family protein [Ilumatobacteraceae bacterium]
MTADPAINRPMIGLSGRRWPVENVPRFPAALAGEEVDIHLAEYPKALAAVGALPIQLTRDADANDMVSRLDGLIITGGADPDPALYGAAPDPQLGGIEPGRDAWELALIEAALRRRLPMLCVCRGAQMLNIAMGGSLIQHIAEPGHGGWDVPRTTRCHTVRVSPGSTAAALYGTELATNSLHHQAVDRPGRGVVVTGIADDGVIESFELEGHPEVFAVQWHPEMMADQPDPAFVWLADEAARFADSHRRQRDGATDPAN